LYFLDIFFRDVVDVELIKGSDWMVIRKGDCCDGGANVSEYVALEGGPIESLLALFACSEDKSPIWCFVMDIFEPL
jgi:hypothetical protein